MKLSLTVFILCAIFALTGNAQIPFTPVDTNFSTKTIVLPQGYSFSTLLIGGVDSVLLGNGTKQLSKESQDLIVYIPKNGSSINGTLYVNHETSGSDALRGNGGGGTVFDVQRTPYDWKVIGDRRKVDFTTVGGTSNNCAGELAPKGTVFTSEETAPANNPGLSWGSDTADFGGYKRYLNNGFMVEVDVQNAVALRKCYAMGRFKHEGCAFLPDHRTAYLTEDETPACLFKFVADNDDDYSSGQLSVYKQSVDGLSGTWLPIPRHRDSINITKTIALRLGATLFIRLEDCALGPNGNLFIAETGNDNANLTINEAAGNKPALHLEAFRATGTSFIRDTFGRILKLDITTGKITNFLQGGKGSDGITCVSNPDNIAIDFKRNLLAFHEDINGTTGGRSLRGLTTCENYYVDLANANPTVNDCKRFLVCPTGGEATGIWFTPDYETYFVNIQHPASSDFFPFSKATTIAISPTNITRKVYNLKSSPFIGSFNNMNIFLGGFSGLDYIPGSGNKFTTVTDRGINAAADVINGGIKTLIFPFPNFAPSVLTVAAEADSIRIMSVLPIQRQNGTSVSGVVPPLGFGNTGEVAWDLSHNPITPDNYAIDCEGIVPGLNNDYWICEEYGTSVWNIDKTSGKIKARYAPFILNPEDKLIDTVFKYRNPNKGFECLAMTPKGKIYAVVQQPLYWPNSTTGDNSRNHRILEIDPTTGKTRMFVYVHEPPTANNKNSNWKVGDMTAINDYEFLIVEHSVKNGEDSKKIFKFDIRGATPITSESYGGKTVEALDPAQFPANGIVPVQKQFFMDFLAAGWDPILDKPEGLTIMNDTTIAMTDDNDFGIDSPNSDGNIIATGKPTRLYIFTLPQAMKMNYVRFADRVNPRLGINTKLVKFDSVEVGQTICKTITLSNPGTNTVNILSQVVVSGEGDFDFTPLSTKDMTIAPGASRTVQICFTPRQNGSREGRISFKTDIPLTYETYRQDTSVISFDVAGSGVSYGKLSIPVKHITDAALVNKQVCHIDTIFNIGTFDVTIDHITLQGANAGNFTVTGLENGKIVPTKGFLVFTICATPSLRGYQSASLSIVGKTNDKVVFASMPVGVYGMNVCASAAPTELFNGKKIIINNSDTEKVVVSNCGDLTETFTAQITNDATNSYTIIGSSISETIAPGNNTAFFIGFSPVSDDPTSATLHITGSDVVPINIPLSGTTANIRLSGLPPNVPSTEVGFTSSDFEISLNNTGNVNITPGVPTITGPYIYRSGGEAPILPGAQGNIKFAFEPTKVGLNSGSVNFDNSNPVLTPVLHIELNGTGLAAQSVSQSNALFSLDNNYPNPAYQQTSFSYELAKASFVKLTLSSITGNIIQQIDAGMRDKGKYSINFDASKLASGIYVYTLSTEYGILSKWMTVLK
jgi:secreted PhoX family phosphatase